MMITEVEKNEMWGYLWNDLDGFSQGGLSCRVRPGALSSGSVRGLPGRIPEFMAAPRLLFASLSLRETIPSRETVLWRGWKHSAKEPG